MNGGDRDTECLSKIFHNGVKCIQNECCAVKQYPQDVPTLKFRVRLGKSLYHMSKVAPQQTYCSEHSRFGDILDCFQYLKVSLEDV